MKYGKKILDITGNIISFYEQFLKFMLKLSIEKHLLNLINSEYKGSIPTDGESYLKEQEAIREQLHEIKKIISLLEELEGYLTECALATQKFSRDNEQSRRYIKLNPIYGKGNNE
jgi:hypothetical protein